MIPLAIVDEAAEHGELALTWLTWRPDGRLPSPLPPSDVFSSEAFPVDMFCDHICRNARDLYRDDVENRIISFRADMKRWVKKEGVSALPLLWIAALRAQRLRLVFDAGIPEISCDPRDFENWCHLTAELDPDALACLELALLDPSRKRGEDAFQHWPLILRTADPDLKALFARGLSDMHLHMKSLAFTSIIWQRCHREARLIERSLRYQQPKHGRDDESKRERRFIEEGLECFAVTRGRHHLALNDFFKKVDPASDDASKGIGDWTVRSPQEILAPYRNMLHQTWTALMSAPEPGTPNARLEADFFHYLSAKTIFRRRHLQHISDANPGLRAFDVIRKRTSHLGRFRSDEVGYYGFNKRHFLLNNALLVASLKDDDGILKRADLRIAPPDGWPIQLAQNYARLGHGLARLFYSREDGLELWSSLHFKRNLKRPESGGKRTRHLPHSWPVLSKIIEYDRETAAFHLMRHRLADIHESESKKKALDVYRRLDLASLERGAGPWLIAPFIRLLRDDPSELQRLAKLPEDAPFALRWRRLHRQGKITSNASLRQLGLTCHAGEDFDTLVQGLSHIAGAIDAWRMGPGDGLGHGLALGASMLAVDVQTSKTIAAGTDLDGLIWLLDYVEKHDLWSSTQTQKLVHAIRDLAVNIYRDVDGVSGLRIDDLATLKAKIRCADRLLWVDPSLALQRLKHQHRMEELARLAEEPGEQLHLIDLFSYPIARKRQRLVPPHAIHREMAETNVLRPVQQQLIKDIKLKGIYLETNPSSNCRMIRSTSYNQLPLIADMISNDPMRFLICTDNPGTYDTSVAQEYSLLFGAMLSKPHALSRDRALSILEEIRCRHPGNDGC